MSLCFTIETIKDPAGFQRGIVPLGRLTRTDATWPVEVIRSLIISILSGKCLTDRRTMSSVKPWRVMLIGDIMSTELDLYCEIRAPSPFVSSRRYRYKSASIHHSSGIPRWMLDIHPDHSQRSGDMHAPGFIAFSSGEDHIPKLQRVTTDEYLDLFRRESDTISLFNTAATGLVI